MMKKSDLKKLIKEALQSYGGGARHQLVAKYIWDNYKHELERSENLLYTWQYDLRWAATELRRRGILKPADQSPRGVWELK